MQEAIDMEGIKKIALGLLKQIDVFCTKHNIMYFLCYGTLLGAVRHKGFIPWDDDIDIMMPREDFERFIALAKNGLGDNTKLLYPEFTPDFFRPFARLYDSRTTLKWRRKKVTIDMGVWVDIFPLDGLPKSTYGQKLHFAIQNIYRNMIFANYVEHKARSFPREIVRRILKLIVTDSVCRLLIKMTMNRSKKYPYTNSEYVAISVAAYGIRNRINRRDVDSAVRMPFEGYEFNVPVGYHQVLTNIFGDYMKFPPLEQQVPRHAFDAFWKEKDA
ncbi:MAG TPA: LicD family protein [Clostridiales bacterium]|nr:LicD family protein [Clostridiales bacterium]